MLAHAKQQWPDGDLGQLRVLLHKVFQGGAQRWLAPVQVGAGDRRLRPVLLHQGQQPFGIAAPDRVLGAMREQNQSGSGDGDGHRMLLMWWVDRLQVRRTPHVAQKKPVSAR
ncbi:hypothetical protein D3C71_1769210 [compost metagenome]